MISYLYQELRPEEVDEVGNSWWPQYVYPVRAGKVIDAYEEGGIVHVYFSVDDYPDYVQNVEGLRENCMEALSTSGANRKFYASIGKSVTPEMLSGTDAIAFNTIIRSLQQDHFRSIERGPRGVKDIASYDPVFLQVLGLKRLQQNDWLGETVENPVYPEPLHDRSYDRAYRLTTADPHILTIGFYHPQWSTVPERSATIEIIVKESLFSTPPPGLLPISSRYDLHEAHFIAERNEKGWLTQLKMQVKSEPRKTPEGDHSPQAGHAKLRGEILAPDWTCWLKLPRSKFAVVLDVLGVAATVGVGALGVLAGQRLQTIPLWVVLTVLIISLTILTLRRWLFGR